MARFSFLTFIDLRFVLPPLLNLFIYYYLSSHKQTLLLYWVDIFLSFPRSTLAMSIFLFLVISFLTFTSITVPFALTLGNRLSLQLGHFSFPWTAAFIASFILSPGVFFYVVYPLTLIISLSQELILKLLRRFLGWLLHTLQRFPVLDIVCILYHVENDTQPPETPQFESPEIEITSAQDQLNSEHELEIVIEG